MAEPLLVGRGVGKRYGGVVALANVDITVDRGEILGLVGPNGAGKTTLVDVITGAQSANSGHLTLDGAILSGPPSRRARAGLARTFQNPQLALDLSVAANLLVGRAAVRQRNPWRVVTSLVAGVVNPHPKSDVDAIRELAAEVGLSGLQRPASDLSLGEQRLVEVARALGQDPTVLLLDEPTSGLGEDEIGRLTRVIEDTKAAGQCAVVLVEHDIAFVMEHADRVTALLRGEIIATGTPAQVRQDNQVRAAYLN